MELKWNNYRPLEGTTIITTLDLHAAGEPFRIITGGLPELKGSTILERRRYMHEHFAGRPYTRSRPPAELLRWNCFSQRNKLACSEIEFSHPALTQFWCLSRGHLGEQYNCSRDSYCVQGFPFCVLFRSGAHHKFIRL